MTAERTEDVRTQRQAQSISTYASTTSHAIDALSHASTNGTNTGDVSMLYPSSALSPTLARGSGRSVPVIHEAADGGDEPEGERSDGEEGEEDEDPPRVREVLDAPREEVLDRRRHAWDAQSKSATDCHCTRAPLTELERSGARSGRISRKEGEEGGSPTNIGAAETGQSVVAR